MRSTNSFSILFFPKPGRKKEHVQNLYVRITYNSARAEYSLKKKINVTNWNSSKGKMMGNSIETKQINTYLTQIRSEIFEAFDQLRKDGSFLSAEAIKSRFLKCDTAEHTLIEMVNYHYEIAKNTIRPGTLKNYKTTKRYIQEFLITRLKTKDLNLAQLNYAFLTQFENFLRMYQPLDHQRPIGNNTVMKHIQRLRKIVTLSVKLEWLDKDPFTQFKAHYERNERQFLSKLELQTIENKTFSIERLQYVKDLFVFSCYTGLSYSDVIELSPEEIVNGIDGKKWIHSTRIKTGIPLKIPLLSIALVLIKKYQDHPKATYRKRVFPKISNQKLNSYLKEIADLCGITKNLTFHLARHTFATTVTLSNGVPIETVSKLLGHSKITTTQIYAKVVERKVSDDMNDLMKVIDMNSIRDTNISTDATRKIS